MKEDKVEKKKVKAKKVGAVVPELKGTQKPMNSMRAMLDGDSSIASKVAKKRC